MKVEITALITNKAVTPIRLVNGTTLLMLNGYTFWYAGASKNHQRWICSSYKKNCRVYIQINDRMQLVKITSYQHSHDRPSYGITSNGLYYKQR
ncbi:hypothetical protein EVAR_9172_1 [Eumeta japonica]|uniref:FLYWCH-type domain-containing protein n=1 Tax=Eumeta variegata TaxID=151549 RepID=A0A4C1WLV3_EUMVA|nr:hypothetical protein EVAR_9172_1 [Eumeta japonica]